ncbi:MAG: sigma-70 family RNA polymerase sigma factor [Proteobacteria bacterium]|nr:sigma-70 family RNA polymerase sigma factor [Pseudomonadota bacterium]
MNRFQTTQWSLVLGAREAPERARRALESLCRTYRPPVHAFICGHHYTAESAEDLTQAFFTRFIEQDLYLKADPQRGRFRTLLLTALKRFLDDERDREGAIKRGGRVQMRSLDSLSDASNAEPAFVDRHSPEYAFHRAWAHAVVKSALRNLRLEARQAGKAALFDELSAFIGERPDDADYARIAEKFAVRRNTLAVAVHRMRQRLRELIRDELAETAISPEDLEHELHELGQSFDLVLP